MRIMPTPEFLHQKYVVEKLNLDEIAELCEYSKSRVRRLIEGAGISCRSPSEAAILRGAKKRGPTLLDDSQKLQELYIDKELTIEEIAKIAGVGRLAVSGQLRRYGIPVRTISEAHIRRSREARGETLLDDPEELKRLYLDEEMGPKEIGRMIGVGSCTVKKHLRRYGIPTRTRSEAKATARTQERISGSNNPRWKGGVSKNRRVRGFNTALKRKIRARDNHCCALCGAKRRLLRELDIHHINFDGNDHREDNLVTLCRSCHAHVHAHQIYVKLEMPR